MSATNEQMKNLANQDNKSAADSPAKDPVLFSKQSTVTAVTDTTHKFYIPKPVDLFGNTFVPTAIIEATEEKQCDELRKICGVKIKVIAPKEISEKWSSFYTGSSSLVEVPASYGPARILSFKEHQQLWQQFLKHSGPEVELREGEMLKKSFFNYD